MARVFSQQADEDVRNLLDRLTDFRTDKEEYARTFYTLGLHFGKMLLDKLGSASTITLASTVEDADYLGRGMIDVLETAGKKVQLTVFWNKRFNPNQENGITVAPILKEFREQGNRANNCLVIIKSIISSSCVVRTNLTRLIEDSSPESIFVVAPVLLKGALATLEKEFDPHISAQFRYMYFAEDDIRTPDGIVQPGIGGDIYTRLGWNVQQNKNKYIPLIVKERRYR